MHNYEILNKPDVDAFLLECSKRDGATAIKGDPPEDAVYGDGEPCTQPVNVGWVCNRTAARIRIIYGREKGNDERG